MEKKLALISNSVTGNISEVFEEQCVQCTEKKSVIRTISIYQDEIPPFAEAEMNSLYGTPYSAIKKFSIYDDLNNVSTYISKINENIVSIFLFRIKDHHLRVLNELVRVDEDEIKVFSETIFRKFGFISAISFGLIETNASRLPFPFQKLNFSENLVVSLPDSVEKYYASLGNATRRNIKYYSNKIKRNFPSFNYQFYEKDMVTEQHIRDIIDLKLASFTARNRRSGLDLGEAEKIFSLVKSCNGLVGIATIDGVVCGGQISYRLGENDVASIIAHDPRYSSYSIGMICCYLTICECIVRKGKEFHFLWGREDYKYRFLGVQRDLYNVNIYRSFLYLVPNIRLVASAAVTARLRTFKLWLLAPQRRERLISRFAIKLFRYTRRFLIEKDTLPGTKTRG